MAASAAAGNNDYTTEIVSALNTANRDGNGPTSLDLSPAAPDAAGAPHKPTSADTPGARLSDTASADTGNATDDTAGGIANGAPSLHDKPTISHALATADHEEKGAAQKAHAGDEDDYYGRDQQRDEDGAGEVAGAAQGQGYGTDVKDLGWHDDVEDVPRPLVAGLSNEELWMLIRRFDKVWKEHRRSGRRTCPVSRCNVPGMPLRIISREPAHCVPAW
jgi:hypothetical protein